MNFFNNIIFSHAGHSANPESIFHYISEPIHLISLLVIASAICVLIRLKIKKSA